MFEFHSDLFQSFASQISDPSRIEEILFHERNCNPRPLFPNLPLPAKTSVLSSSYAGILLFFSEFEKLCPEKKMKQSFHAYVLKIKEAIEQEGISSIALFGGLTGTCFAIQNASLLGERYQRMLQTLNNYLQKRVEKKTLPVLQQHFEMKNPPRMCLYDLIQGVTGVGVYGLTISYLSPLVEKIIMQLLSLAKSIMMYGKQVPGWFLAPDDPYLWNNLNLYPKGNINLGLAHGITGILAFLSIALLRGFNVDNQKGVIAEIAKWLKDKRRGRRKEYFWEAVISFEEYTEQSSSSYIPSRDAWCHGTPGVARSLFLAGKALQDESLKDFALESFLSVFERGQNRWDLAGASLCHGISGLLLITHFMYEDTQNQNLKRHKDELKNILLHFYEKKSPFGFKHLEPCADHSYFGVDKLDLLEGATGIYLTLFTIEGHNSNWHLPLLVSEGIYE